jgi:hypothetical protein
MRASALPRNGLGCLKFEGSDMLCSVVFQVSHSHSAIHSDQNVVRMSSRLASQTGWSFSQFNKLLRALLRISSSEASKRNSHNKLVGESCPSEKFKDGEKLKGRCNSGFSVEG